MMNDYLLTVTGWSENSRSTKHTTSCLYHAARQLSKMQHAACGSIKGNGIDLGFMRDDSGKFVLVSANEAGSQAVQSRLNDEVDSRFPIEKYISAAHFFKPVP